MFTQANNHRAAGRVQLEFVDEETGKQVSQELYDHSYALLVGVSNYTTGWPALLGVLKDLQQVEVTLEKHGFVVETDQLEVFLLM